MKFYRQTLWLEIDRYIGLANISGQYLGFTNISLSAISKCWQSAVIFLMHADILHNKVQWTKSRQWSCCNVRVRFHKQADTDKPLSTRRPLQPKQKHHH